MKGFIKFVFLIVYLFYSANLAALSETSRISLLTCSPGTEIYALFGHTAIRIEDPESDLDVVFNYGIFNFDSPNFIWRFVKGETDYQLGTSSFDRFKYEYSVRGSYVVQQTLNLTFEEKIKLWEILMTNYLPQNRVYRYNYFFDNCTTRARDKIEEGVSGIIAYKEDNRPLSYRDIIHQYTENNRWARFGIDFCLGSKADEIIDYRQKMFAPFYLMDAMEEAWIIENDVRRLLIESTLTVVSPLNGQKNNEMEKGVRPLFTNWVIFIIIFIVSGIGVIRNKRFWGIDVSLFGLAGLAGCIIGFLVLFSIHPAVSPNYLLLFLNPIHLFYLPFMIYHYLKCKKEYYHWVNLLVLTLFIALWPLFPQRFNPAVLPLALCLLTRSLSQIVLYYKINK